MNKPSRITVLSPELANQIAAGEVVERPASVVKELVENSLDAGATFVEVDVQGGGLHLLRITDNGTGMTAEEAKLSLKRHATSKIRTSADLFNIQTLGFRGEALPSVSAVSKLTLVTRTMDDLGGFLLETLEGRLHGPGREIGAAVGTQIEVKDLFYNVPARLKFMKSEATEFGHIQETLIRLALAFPAVHFRLKKSGKVAFELPCHGTRQERAEAALKTRGSISQDISLHRALFRKDGVELEALLSDPSASVSSARNIYLFVNRRFIRDRAILQAIKSGYGDTIDSGRFPTAVLYLHIPEAEVDVNVHPQKLEARFVHSQALYAAVHETVQRLVVRSPWVLSSSPVEPKDEPSWDTASPWAAEPRPTYGQPRAKGDPAPSFASESIGSYRRPTHSVERVHQSSLDLKGAPKYTGSLPNQTGTQTPSARILFGQMEYLGQLLKTYLVCEGEGDLILIDQHAAHERIAFERLRSAQQKRQVKAQHLLFPMNLDFDAVRAGLIEDYLSELAALGFELRPFGGHSFALISIPDMAEFGRGATIHTDPKMMLDKVLDDLEQQGKSTAPQDRIEQVLATIACHSVVRAGDVLATAQAKALLSAMDEAEFAPYCPHGRPILIRLSKPELERRFGRIS